MKEEDLIALGFTREDDLGVACSNEAGDTWTEDSFHYYVYEITGGLSLISGDSDDALAEGHWHVEFFNTEQAVRFNTREEVASLMELLMDAIVPEKTVKA